MKIIPAKDLPALDLATIRAQKISSTELMERAAKAVFQYLKEEPVTHVLCGTGNNGGDGYVLARLLLSHNPDLVVIDCSISPKRSSDNQLVRERFSKVRPAGIQILQESDPFPNLPASAHIIDAVFGSGLSRPVQGYWAKLFEHLNTSGARISSIDLPSGLFADKATSSVTIKATTTYSLGTPKLAEFATQNESAYGDIVSVDIGLDRTHIEAISTEYSTVDTALLKNMLHKRGRFAHKGTFGHALMVAGSRGKIGAATLSAKAALRSGAGLITVHLPRCGYEIMQISFPEAMCSIDQHRYVTTKIPKSADFAAVGIGPGLGTEQLTVKALETFLRQATKPVVLDADALNILSKNPSILSLVPSNSILTPHPKEFERLFGPSSNDFERWELLRKKAAELKVIILLKGGNTAVACPQSQQIVFNTTGNPGMGTAGTGDVLTGILTGLLAQAYSPKQTAILGAYLHGSAGDLAAAELQQESLLASDLIDHLGVAFQELRASAS